MTAGIDLTADPIAFGRTAEVFAVGDDQILKLLKPGFDSRMLSVEFAKTAAVHAASGLAPEVSGLVEVDGRPGVLFERIFGASMLDLIMSSQDEAANHAVAFAYLHGEILNVSTIKDLPGVKEFMADKIDRADLPLAQRTVAKDHMMGLSDGDATLHGDYHPGNILVTPDGSKVIDWGEASRGDAAADIARTMVLLTPESAAIVVPHPGSIAAFISEFANAYLKRCLQVTSATIETVAAWRLPVVAARLSEGIAEQTGLLQAEVARLTA
jgi:serine/threonine protein kinase